MFRKIKAILLRHNAVVALLITTSCCVLAFVGAYVLRFDFGQIPNAYWKGFVIGLPLIVTIRMGALYVFGTHRGLYRYASIHDFIQLFKAVSMGGIIFVAVWSLLFGNRYVMPRSIYVLEWILVMSALLGLRIVVRLWRVTFRNKLKGIDPAKIKNVLILGAGNKGEAVLRMVDLRFMGRDMNVVGFVDHNPSKHGSLIHGVPVLGDPSRIPEFVREYEVQTLLFAITEPRMGLFEQVIESCASLDVNFQMVSVLQDAFTGEMQVEKVRDLKIEDLLGRQPVELDNRPIQERMTGKTVMITGAGGSIGSELSRQIASFTPDRIVLFDVAESPLFEIDRELQQFYPDLKITSVIGDIKQADVVNRVFEEMRPHLVYHAAAYKHVPLMEAHPDEAVLNNVRGTRHLADAACRYGCECFVMISTDKAVRPSNVMGATKRICELLIQSRNGKGTIFSAVRFGNVLGSNGSVIPIFKKQIEAGGPLTVTHPEMTRFFMTIPEAVSLVLQCGAIAEAGDVFVLDMGQPVKIMDLARNMIRLSGLRVDEDISIEVSGIRPGEKMYEELIAYGENLKATSVPKVNVLKKVGGDRCGFGFTLLKCLMEELAEARDTEGVRKLLWLIIALDDQMSNGKKDCYRLCNQIRVEKKVPPVREGDLEDIPVQGTVLAIGFGPEEQLDLRNVLLSVGHESHFVDSWNEALKLIVSETSYSAIICDYYVSGKTIWRLRDDLHNLGVKIPLVAAICCDSLNKCKEFREMDEDIHQLIRPINEEKVRELPVFNG